MAVAACRFAIVHNLHEVPPVRAISPGKITTISMSRVSWGVSGATNASPTLSSGPCGTVRGSSRLVQYEGRV